MRGRKGKREGHGEREAGSQGRKEGITCSAGNKTGTSPSKVQSRSSSIYGNIILVWTFSLPMAPLTNLGFPHPGEPDTPTMSNMNGLDSHDDLSVS